MNFNVHNIHVVSPGLAKLVRKFPKKLQKQPRKFPRHPKRNEITIKWISKENRLQVYF